MKMPEISPRSVLEGSFTSPYSVASLHAASSSAVHALTQLGLLNGFDNSCTAWNHPPSAQVQWNRAARTDKGVSAAGNVVSLKMMIGYPDIVERINSQLPPQVLPLSCHPYLYIT